MTLLPNKVTFTNTGGQDVNISFWGTQFNLQQIPNITRELQIKTTMRMSTTMAKIFQKHLTVLSVDSNVEQIEFSYIAGGW